MKFGALRAIATFYRYFGLTLIALAIFLVVVGIITAFSITPIDGWSVVIGAGACLLIGTGMMATADLFQLALDIHRHVTNEKRPGNRASVQRLPR